MADFQGEVKGKIIEVRFALAGKIVRVNKHTGDSVSKLDLLAALDRKILQAELDRQLSDFEKTRAEFEIFSQKQIEPIDTIGKYLKTGKQAELNASVKDVEIAKSKLDQCDLISPIDGIVMDDGNMTQGIFITPSNTPISILETNSFYFEFEIPQNEIWNFESTKNLEVEIEGFTDKFPGTTSQVFSDNKRFSLRINLQNNNKLLLGLKGKVSF